MRAVVDSLSRSTLDTFVFSKPFFDRHGLTLAFEDDKPIGFVHAGFGPNADHSDLDFSIGIISALRTVEGDSISQISRELLTRACDYLRAKGATDVHFGSQYPYSPFYLGLYGGAQIGGVLDEDESTATSLREFGFTESEKIITYSRTLAGFRTIVDRHQMSIRRQFQITAVADPIEQSWWECCTLGLAERDCFHAVQRSCADAAATVRYWDIQPLASKWGVSARGIHELMIQPGQDESGLKLFLLGESMRHLRQQGIGLVEAQCPASDRSTIECLEMLKYQQTGQSTPMSLSVA